MASGLNFAEFSQPNPLTSKVDIRVLLVEFSHIDKKKLLDVMDKAGYDNPFNLREDLVFVKRNVH